MWYFLNRNFPYKVNFSVCLYFDRTSGPYLPVFVNTRSSLEVWEAKPTNNPEGKSWAVKKVPTSIIQQHGLSEQMDREIAILRKLKHQFIKGHKGVGGFEWQFEMLFDMNGWMENDWAMIAHHFRSVSSKTMIGNVWQVDFHTF